jgi:hypothetical protein
MADARGHLRRATGHRALVMLGLTLVAAFGLRAQVPAPVQFTVFSAKPIAGLGYAPRPNASPEKITFQPTSRSSRYEYRGAQPLRFVDTASGAVVAEAQIPAGMRDALLLFSPIEKPVGTLRYQVAVLDDGAARHGAGGLAIINLSGLALSGTVNKESVTLKPGLNPTLNVGTSAKITLTTEFKNRRYQAYTGTASLGRTERALLILFPPFYQGGLEVQSRLLVDQPPGTAAAKKTPAAKGK